MWLVYLEIAVLKICMGSFITDRYQKKLALKSYFVQIVRLIPVDLWC